MTVSSLPPLLPILLLLTGCTTPSQSPQPRGEAYTQTYRQDAAGRYIGRDELRTNAATGRPEVMHYDAQGRYIGVSR